jgi:large exoprotein involved in heme utilization and adhesion
MKSSFFILVLAWFGIGFSHAEIITDGHLSGNVSNLSLDNQQYAIKQDLGHTEGTNLFHSFQNFNLQSGETAVFQAALRLQM